MTTQINAEKPQAGGFVAGTLVHTKEGLKPIEEIKVGDWVLSKPENGEGEQAYKRVTRTYEFDDKAIWSINFTGGEDVGFADPYSSDRLFVTGDHPFWVVGITELFMPVYCEIELPDLINRWIPANKLAPGIVLLLADGSLVQTLDVCQLVQTKYLDMAWYDLNNDIFPDNRVQLIDFSCANPDVCVGDVLDKQGRVIFEAIGGDSQYYPPPDTQVYLNEDETVKWYSRKVYNLEVEGYHAYFVAKQGVRVNAH